MTIKFGPAGLGAVREAIETLEEYKKLGLTACEIAFTYGVYIKKQSDMTIIKQAADRLGIKLSIHAPYWLNLNSKEPEKVEKSKQRVLKCCEVGHKLGAKLVVFHSGYYSGMDKEEAYQNIKKQIIEIQDEIKKNKWNIKLAPEIMGKVNVFGSIEEISRLVKETGCSFCIDFAHILARYKKYEFELVKKQFGKYKDWHCHFSGIVYSEKGERNHKKTEKEHWKKVLKNLPKGKNITIINESPDPINDSVAGLELSKKI